MMLRYRTPGVHFENSDEPSVHSVRTDIAGFVGIAERGPLHTPVRIESWTQFVSAFGQHLPQAYLAYAVQGFFVNGGSACYVVRVADPDHARCASLDVYDPSGWPLLRLLAASEGAWGESIRVTATLTGNQRFTLIIDDAGSGHEVWRDLTWGDAGSRSDAVKLLNGERVAGGANAGQASRLVRAAWIGGVAGPNAAGKSSDVHLELAGGVQTATLTGGADGLSTLQPQHLAGAAGEGDRLWGLAALERIPDVAIVAIPDSVTAPSVPLLPSPRPPKRCTPEDEPAAPPAGAPTPEPEWPPASDRDGVCWLQLQLIGHCESLKDRVAILDTPGPAWEVEDVLDWRSQFDTSYAALYYPWLLVEDPLQPAGVLRPVPACGHLAGIYARVEAETGVHKPPANELILAAADITVAIGDITHGELNDSQVDVLRAYPGRGLRVAGARTLSSDLRWRFVNVRRLLIMIERAIETQTQWIVFEPSNRDLWREIDRVLRNLLDSIWRRGMLNGATAAEAYTVACDEHTNPPEEVDAGRVITVIGVQPPPPAEFVVIRIGRTEAGTEILEGSSA